MYYTTPTPHGTPHTPGAQTAEATRTCRVQGKHVLCGLEEREANMSTNLPLFGVSRDNTTALCVVLGNPHFFYILRSLGGGRGRGRRREGGGRGGGGGREGKEEGGREGGRGREGEEEEGGRGRGRTREGEGKEGGERGSREGGGGEEEGGQEYSDEKQVVQ